MADKIKLRETIVENNYPENVTKDTSTDKSEVALSEHHPEEILVLPNDDESDIEEQVALTPSSAPSVNNDKESQNLLSSYSLTGSSEDLAKQNVQAFLVLYFLALRGQWTLIYAAPNTGKTVLAIHMLRLACQKNSSLCKDVYYINADDNYDGMIEKLREAERAGYNMIVPGYKGFKAVNLVELLQRLCSSGQARHTVLILDTLKKFSDLMDKSRQRKFGESVRAFVLSGGTVIALAHTNKRPGPDGRPVPEGTADMINDSDCVYLLAETARDERKQLKTVTLENIKNRGRVPLLLSFEYSTKPDQKYEELLGSIKRVDEQELAERKIIAERSFDLPIIQAITSSIQTGITSKMALSSAAADICGDSKRKVLQIINKYTGDDPAKHLWSFVRSGHGKMAYRLLAEEEDNEIY